MKGNLFIVIDKAKIMILLQETTQQRYFRTNDFLHYEVCYSIFNLHHAAEVGFHMEVIVLDEENSEDWSDNEAQQQDQVGADSETSLDVEYVGPISPDDG